jgi:uncharacterized protein
MQANIQESIKAKIKESMMAKDMPRLQVLRGISAAFTNELVSQQRPPQEVLSDEDCIKVIKKLVKQRKDSIEQFVNGGREDLASDEKAELLILESLLPAQMKGDELVNAVKAELEKIKTANGGELDASKKGQITGQIIKSLSDNADGKEIKDILDNLI